MRRVLLAVALLTGCLALPVGAWAWVFATVDTSPGTNATGYGTSIALDANGRPGISYWDAAKLVKYAQFDGAAWDITTVAVANAGTDTSLLFNAAGEACVSYCSGGLHYDRQTDPDTNTWVRNQVDTSGGGYHETLLDANGNACVAYSRDFHDLRYASSTNNGSSWVRGVVDAAQFSGQYADMAFDPDGNAAIASIDNYQDLRFHHWNGSRWESSTVAAGSFKSPSLAYDRDGNACISYNDGTNLKFARLKDGVWQFFTVDTGDLGYYSSLAFDPAGNPCISYGTWWYDQAGLKYAHWDPAQEKFVPTAVETLNDWAYYSDLVIDATGGVHISYQNGLTGDLMYAYQEGEAPPNGPTPELSTWALLACSGLFGVGMLRRRRTA